MSDERTVYHRVGWADFNVYQRKRIGLNEYLEDVEGAGFELPIYRSLLTDSGFTVIQSAMLSTEENPRDRLIKDRTEASLGRLSANYGFAEVVAQINTLVLRFQRTAYPKERDEIATLITEICLLPLLEEGHPVLPPKGTADAFPSREGMTQTANALIQSPLFPVEFFFSKDAKRAVMNSVSEEIDGCDLFRDDFEKFVIAGMMKRSVKLLAFAVFTVAFRYAEAIRLYSSLFTAESSQDRQGSAVYQSPFAAGLRRGMGTNLGRGGIDAARLSDIVQLTTYDLFLANDPLLLAQLSYATPSFLRNPPSASTAAEKIIEDAFNGFKDDREQCVCEFLEAKEADGASLNPTEGESDILRREVFMGGFLEFYKELKNKA